MKEGQSEVRKPTMFLFGEVETRQAMRDGAARILDTRANLESQVDHRTRLCAAWDARLLTRNGRVVSRHPGSRTS